MDEKQLQLLFDQYGQKSGFSDFAEFKGLMADSSARRVFFDNSNKDLGFKDYNEFESLIGFKKKDGGPALPSSPSLELPSVSTEPAKRLTYTDINSSIESLSKAQKNLRDLETGGSVSPGGYNPARANIDASVLASAKKTADQARAERDKVFSEYAGEISRPVEQLIQSQDYTKFFTPSGNIDYGKAREHFQKVSQQFGGGPALVEHWVANLKMRGQGEIERKEVKPLFEQNLKNLGLQKYADQEQYAKGVYEGVVRKNKDQVDLLIQDRDQRAKSLLDQSKTSVDALTADFNQKVEELNGLISAGSINEQTAKTQYDALRSNYDKTVADINKGYQSEVGKINRQVKQKYGRINQELDAISKDKDFVMKSIPESDRKLIDKAYIDASAKRMMGIDAVDRAVDAAGGLSGLFARSVTSGFLSGIASMGDALSSGGYSNKLVDWMQSKRTSAEELKPAEYTWSRDPLKRAITSSGQSLGASAPLLAPSIGLMAATGGSAAGVVGSALLSYYGENKQNAGQVYRDVLEQSGDVALARDQARDYFQKTAVTLPLYFVGSLGEKALVLGKGMKKAVAGFGLELAEEIPVEYIQSHAEAVTSQGYKGTLAQYIKDNPELMLDLVVGTGVQAGAMKTVSAAFSKVAAASPAPQTQTMADAIMTQGREFAARLVQTQFDQGLINEQKRDELFQSIGTIEANLAKLDELGVRGDAAKLHMALSQEMAELQARRKSEKDESIQGLLDQQIAELKTQMTGVLTGQTEYIVFGMPGDVNSKTMLASTFNALDQQAKDDVIRSAKSVTVINNPQLNQQLQDQKQTLGNPEGAPEGAYETDATVQSQVEQQAGPAEGGVQERPGVDGGQQEVGQGAGQQGQAPVTQPDTGDRVLSSQEEVALAGELRGELRQDFQPIIDRAAQSLQAANVQFEVLDDAEFTARVGQSAEGAFMTVGNDGKILLNRQKMEQADPGVIIWHESAHPVMNTIRNTNKPLYDRMVTGLKQVAQRSPELQRALEFGKQYGAKLREAGRGDAEAIALEDDESIVESIAMIASDDKLMASLPTSVKQTLIDFVNYIAKALGIKGRVTNTASADFRRTAQQIATALKEGRDITEIVGAENVGMIDNRIMSDYASASNSASPDQSIDFDTPIQLSIAGRDAGPEPSGWLKSDMFISASDIPNLSISKVIFYDNTKVGPIELRNRLDQNLVSKANGKGGFGYSFQEEALNTKALLAFTSPGAASQIINRQAMFPNSVMAVAMQNPMSAHLGNITTKDLLWGPDGQFRLVATNKKRDSQIVKIFKESVSAARALSKSDVDIAAYDRIIAKFQSIKTVEDIYNVAMNPESFGIRNQIHVAMLQEKPTKVTASTRESHKILHYELGIPTLKEIADAVSEDYFKNATTGDLVKYVKPSTEKVVYTTLPEVYEKYKTTKADYKVEFLDGMPNHESYPFVIKGENIGIGEKYFGANDVFESIREKGVTKKGSFFPVGRMKKDSPIGAIPQTAETYGSPNVQLSIGGRKMSSAPDYKQRSNVASDNLVRIFQRNNTPLTKDEAIAIVDDLRDWTDWYDGLATYVEGIFGEYAQDVLSLLPLASQANNSAGTVSLAISNAERVYKGESPKGVAEYYGYVSKFLQGMGIESDKMSNFLRAISGNPDAIAVDMHVWSIIKGTDPNKKSVNPKDKAQFDAAKDFVNSVSEAMGIEPRGVQAALWAGNILRTGGKPDSYEQYFADHVNNKGLTERIESWRESGYQPFTPARKQRQEATGIQLSIGNRQAIIDKAKADGTYLKAPNGQPTNLSEDQWTTVRTPEFKNWFGDWENDPTNASKVVDENGEPMVVYHGSKNKFDEFKIKPGSKSKSRMQLLFGSHFATNKSDASIYAGDDGKIYNTYLSIKNPINLSVGYVSKSDNNFSAYVELAQSLGLPKKFSNVFDYVLFTESGDYGGKSSEVERVFITQAMLDSIAPSKVMGALVDAGFNGVAYTPYQPVDINAAKNFSESFIAFSPNQIKSATSNVGTFSTEDNRIQFSAGPRAESRVEFKLVAFVLRKKAEGYTDQQIAKAIRTALPGITTAQLDALISDPKEFLRRAYPGITPMQFENLLRRAEVKNIYRGNMPQNIAGRFLTAVVPNEVLEKYYMQVKTKAQVRKDAINQFLTKNFDPAKGLPKWVMQLKEFSTGAKNIEIARAKSTIDRLAKTAREIGFTDWELFSAALRNLNEEEAIMSGSTELAMFDPATGMAMVPSAGERLQTPMTMLRLPLEIQPYVREMRNQIDALSKRLITGGFVTPEQAVKIEMNLGEYTNRAYKLYTQKGFTPTKEAFDAAVTFLADQEYRRLLTEYVNNLSVAVRGQIGVQTGAGPIVAESGTGIPYADLMEQAAQYAQRRANDIITKKETPYFGGSGPTSRGLGILKQRQTIPQPIRALMGEYTDPGVVFMMTVAKQAELAATSDYLRQLRDQGLGTLFFEKNDPNRPATHSVPLAGETSATMEPLNGLYTTKEIAEAFEDAVNTRNAVVQLWMKIVGANRWLKTVGSIRTQFVNFESNLGFAVLNGLVFTKDGRPTWRSKSITEAKEYVKGQYGPKEISEITEKAIKLGLVGQNIDINAVRQAFREDDMFEMALDVSLTSDGVFRKTSRKVRPVSFFNKLYRMGDDFWKVYGYITERETVANGRYDSKYDQLTDEQKEAVDKEAADRVKDTWPTYDRMFEAVRKLSQNVPILGNFTAFQAESIRVLMNAVRLMKKDLADPQMRQAGVRRALGISTYLGLRTGITTMTALSMGYGVSGLLGLLLNDDDEEDKKWAIKQVSPIFMRSGDLLIKQDKDKPHIYTVVDLLSIDPIGITQRSLNSFTEGSDNTDAGVGAAVAELFGGFLGREMTFKAVEDLSMNRNSANGLKIYNDEDTAGEAVGKITSYLWKSLKPSSVGLVERALTNENKAFEASAFVGFRPYEIDLHQSFNISLTRMRNSVEEISTEYFKIKFDPKVSEEDKEQARLRAGEKKAEVIKKYNRLYTTLIKLGASQQVMEEMVEGKSAVKPTGMDGKTKLGIIEGEVDPTSLY